jgi:hypothetical protein
MLARDDQATESDGTRPPIGKGRVRHRAEAIERLPEQRHHLAPGIEPHDRVGVAEALRFADRRQGRRLGGGQAQVHRPARGR